MAGNLPNIYEGDRHVTHKISESFWLSKELPYHVQVRSGKAFHIKVGQEVMTLDPDDGPHHVAVIHVLSFCMKAEPEVESDLPIGFISHK